MNLSHNNLIRKGTLAAAWLFALMGAAHASAEPINYFSCDFSEGIPADFGRHDLDGATLEFTAWQHGFDTTDSWIAFTDFSGQICAASCSQFDDPTAQANDWLITPAIWIRGAGAQLSWQGQSINEQGYEQSSYRVLVTDRGPTPDDFAEAEVLAEITDETLDEWVDHTASLAAWQGKRVYIAFVNISSCTQMIGIDNISVDGEPGLAAVSFFPGEYAIGSEDVKVGATIVATSQEPITSVDLNCQVGSTTLTKSLNGLNLQPGDTLTVELDQRVRAEYGDRLDIAVTPTINGVDFGRSEWQSTVLAFLAPKRVVVEEATGMWCAFCPKGIVAMETLQERYPEQFIGIAVHQFASMDPLVVESYTSLEFPDGAPTAWLNRRAYCKELMPSHREGGIYYYTTLDGGLESYFLDELKRTPLGQITPTVSAFDGYNCTISAKLRFPMRFSGVDFQVALAVVEDSVWEEGYFQLNRYGGTPERLGGFENLPQRIESDFAFNHVARGIFSTIQGFPSSSMTEIEANVDYDFERTINIPHECDKQHVRIVAMIVDCTSGEIVNAEQIPLLTAALPGVGAEASQVAVTRTAEGIVLTAADGAPIAATLTDVAGRTVAKAVGHGTATLAAPAQRGVYILSIAGQPARKLSF